MTPGPVAGLVPWMQQRAERLDREAAFPAEEMDRLRAIGALEPALPVQGPERNDAAAEALASLLIQVGQGNLSVGRVLEAHINTLHLAARYGTPAQWQAVRQSVREGVLYALWVTDPPDGGLLMQRHGDRIRLSGAKQFCSAAGFATGTLLTAHDPEGRRWMLVVPLGIGETVTPLPSPLSGMRAAVTGAVDFTGCEVSADTVLGQSGDYLREPDFSAGAWRGSAVALGGLVALLDHAVTQLRTSGRLDSPHTQARLGEAFIARETARQWVRTVALVAEDPTLDAEQRVATVNLGRIAVETACLDAMRLVQRSLGLTSFRQGNPVERICRDLATYLRQPAPDETLIYGASWFASHPDATAMR
ncbi:MAG TPA: acyl-CoA dehydrogenase [Rhodopila sp.]|nr:acyl-CoA dehydrogenase [Rhodopila sp.]